MVHKVGFEPTKHNAVDLESTPFDRSGICANIHDGIRTSNPQIRSLVRYPIAPHGQYLTRVTRTPDKWIYSPLLYQLSYSEIN